MFFYKSFLQFGYTENRAITTSDILSLCFLSFASPNTSTKKKIETKRLYGPKAPASVTEEG